MIGIYKIQSLKKADRCYIGSSINISRRWNEHLRELNKGVHRSKKLQRHFNKYGRSDLQFSILIGCDEKNLISNEQFFIDAFNPYFNCIKIAGNSKKPKGQIPWNKNIPMTNEQKEKISKLLKGRTTWNKGKKYHFHNKRDNSVYKGKIFTEETRQKIREAAKKRPQMSEETKRKISLSSLGNKNMLGRPVSEETRKKISETLKGNVPWNKGLKYKHKIA